MKQSLNFGWGFLPAYQESYLTALPKEKELVDLPHTVKITPVNYFQEESYQGLFTYEKIFDVEDDLPVHLLRFEGAMLKIHVYLNEVDFGEHVSGYFPVEIDVSKAIRKNLNRLLVILDSREDPEIPPFGNVVDYLTFGGIYRPVYLIGHENSYIKELGAFSKADGSLYIRPEIVGDKKPHFTLYDAYHKVKEFDEYDVKIDGIEPWSIAHPKLYTLKSKIGNEIREDKIGFRDIAWREDGFYLNGERIKLRGLNRHQSYPYLGYAAPASLQKEDAWILKKQLQVNIVRTSHYSDDDAFLEACDELGLLYVNEVPGWQYIGQDEAWRKNFLSFVERLVKKERNHPSLIAYGLRVDESPDDHELYKEANQIQKKLDPSRPSLGVRNFKDSELLEDIYAYNDFSCSGRLHGLDKPATWKGAIGKPKLVSEFNGHMFPTKSFDPTDRRLEQAMRHARVLDDAYGYENLTGAIGWCAFDYNTHKDFGADDHICYHGVSDIYRNPKAAAYLYASQGDELPVFHVASLMQVGDIDESAMGEIVCFTNADYVELYVGDEKIKDFYPDRKSFPHLPHPPIVIDDLIGERFQEEKIKGWKKDAIVKGLNLACQKGFSHMKLNELLPVAGASLFSGQSFSSLYKLYNKYIQNWGQRSSTWFFKAYKGNRVIASKKLGASTEFGYLLRCHHGHLKNGDTYDMARVSLEKVDQFQTRMPYSQEVIHVETEGPIEVVGPKEFALVGGSSAIFVKSLPVKKETLATLKVKGEAGESEIRLVVE